MRWKTTVLLALILLALGTFYYVYEIRLAPGREKAEREKDRLWSVEAKDVEEVIFKRKDDTVHLRRQGDGWELLVPVKARGEKTAIQDVVANLVAARVEREIDPNPARLDDFGLDKPAAEITLRVKGRREPQSLLLGGKNPTGVWVYGKTADKPAVLALSDFILRDVTKPVVDFRDRTILAFDRKEVTGLELSGKGQLLAAELQGNRWAVTRPMPFKADEERITDFLDKILFTKVKEFVSDAPPALTPYGLDQPARITVWLGREKSQVSRELLLGKVNATKKGVYAARPGEQSVLLLGEEIWELLPKTAFDLRDKTVVSYESERTVKVMVESPRGAVTFAREGQEWRITAPEPLKADGEAVSSYLWKLRDLRARAVVAESAEAAGRYLAKPQVRVSLWEQGAPAPKTVLLGPSAEQRDGKPMAYAAVAGQGPLVLVEAKLLEELTKSVADFRERFLLGSFDAKSVNRLQIKSGGQAMLVERDGESEWRVLEPRKGKAKEEVVSRLLSTLRALKWSEQISGKEEGSGYGLDRPSSEVTLWRKDGSEIGGLVVGRRDRDKTYVKTKASPALYAVEAKQLDRFPKTPDDLQ